MQELSRAVLEGATAYLKQQYKVVGLFFVAAVRGARGYLLRA